MIRSPIDKHDRMVNRVEEAEKRHSDLEKRVAALEAKFADQREMLIAHGESLDDDERRVDALETAMDDVFTALARLLAEAGYDVVYDR